MMTGKDTDQGIEGATTGQVTPLIIGIDHADLQEIGEMIIGHTIHLMMRDIEEDLGIGGAIIGGMTHIMMVMGVL